MLGNTDEFAFLPGAFAPWSVLCARVYVRIHVRTCVHDQVEEGGHDECRGRTCCRSEGRKRSPAPGWRLQGWREAWWCRRSVELASKGGWGFRRKLLGTMSPRGSDPETWSLSTLRRWLVQRGNISGALGQDKIVLNPSCCHCEVIWVYPVAFPEELHLSMTYSKPQGWL